MQRKKKIFSTKVKVIQTICQIILAAFRIKKKQDEVFKAPTVWWLNDWLLERWRTRALEKFEQNRRINELSLLVS